MNSIVYNKSKIYGDVEYTKSNKRPSNYTYKLWGPFSSKQNVVYVGAHHNAKLIKYFKFVLSHRCKRLNRCNVHKIDNRENQKDC